MGNESVDMICYERWTQSLDDVVVGQRGSVDGGERRRICVSFEGRHLVDALDVRSPHRVARPVTRSGHAATRTDPARSMSRKALNVSRSRPPNRELSGAAGRPGPRAQLRGVVEHPLHRRRHAGVAGLRHGLRARDQGPDQPPRFDHINGRCPITRPDLGGDPRALRDPADDEDG